MKPKCQSHSEKVLPFTPIRIEKELSKFPIHNLTKKGVLDIDIIGKDKEGRDFRWRVAPNRTYGEPRELAYKLDTLLINRRIEAAAPIKPKVIKLGSLRSICKELELAASGKNTSDVKNSLRQNAHTGITAKIRYTGRDGVERTIEGDFNRYSVLFTGERFPDGKKADSVYIILNDVYREVLTNAGTRPLDYDYLKKLSPTAQRFYELVSPQIFAAIKYNLPFAKYAYSDYCTYSAQSRYFERERVRKQMYKVTKLHKEFGYLDAVTFEETTDRKGHPDWLMCLSPGPKAHVEFNQFSHRTRLNKARVVEDEGEGEIEIGDESQEPLDQFQGGLFLSLIKGAIKGLNETDGEL